MLPIDAGILQYAFCSCFSIHWEINHGFTLKQLLLGGLSGTLWAIGDTFMAQGVAEGYGGPAQAIMTTNSVYLTILTSLVDDQELSVLQILAIVFGLTGGITIALGDQIAKINCFSREKEI